MKETVNKYFFFDFLLKPHTFVIFIHLFSSKSGWHDGKRVVLIGAPTGLHLLHNQSGVSGRKTRDTRCMMGPTHTMLSQGWLWWRSVHVQMCTYMCVHSGWRSSFMFPSSGSVKISDWDLNERKAKGLDFYWLSHSSIYQTSFLSFFYLFYFEQF